MTKLTYIKTSYLNFDDEDNSEYILSETDNRLELLEGGIILIDSGNDLSIKFNRKTVKLDYSELEELLILLKYREIKIKHQFKLLELKEVD